MGEARGPRGKTVPPTRPPEVAEMEQRIMTAPQTDLAGIVRAVGEAFSGG